MEGGGDVMPLDLYEHMVTDDASGGASPGVSSTSNQAFLMDNWVHQLYEQVLCLNLPSFLNHTILAFFCCPFLYLEELHDTVTSCQTVTPSSTHATLSYYVTLLQSSLRNSTRLSSISHVFLVTIVEGGLLEESSLSKKS